MCCKSDYLNMFTLDYLTSVCEKSQAHQVTACSLIITNVPPFWVQMMSCDT